MVASGGLYAPTIRHQKGITYIVCTNVKPPEGSPLPVTENFIVSTQDIYSDTWSDPIYFEFHGIDPSIFFDDDGRSYIHGSAGPAPMTTINLFEIDLGTGKKLGEARKIWGGTGGVFPEGPHMYKKDGWYYLMISEGGTHEGHMITVSRSRDIWGPYDSFEKNPILTARGTDEYIQYTGHCDVFQDRVGQWWGVCLGVRKDTEGRYVMGRETFLTPARWPEGGWPSLDRIICSPRGFSPEHGASTLTAKPKVDYLYIRDVHLNNYTFSEDGNVITLKPSSADLSDPSESPTFVGKRQRRLKGASTVTVHPGSRPWPGSVKAGLAVYKDDHRFVRIFYSAADAAVVWEVRNDAKKIHQVSIHDLRLTHALALRLEYTEREYRLLYAHGSAQGCDTQWQTAGTLDTLDTTGPDFVGPVVGIFAVAAENETIDIEFRGLKID